MMPARAIYLDHLASTPVRPEVLEAMQPYFLERFGSPSSLHRHGLQARDALVRARREVAELIHAAAPEDIIFTSGGTEAINLAVQGVARANAGRGRHLVIGAVEHPAVLGSVEFLEALGFTCTRVGVDGVGRVDPAAVGAAVTDGTILICVQHANGDIGTFQPIGEIAEIAAARGIPLCVDATASGGWAPIDVEGLGIGLLALAPHRFYGPKGVGVLYKNRRVRLAGILHGGLQENGRRAGTENVPGIVGAGVAAVLAGRDLSERVTHTRRLQERLWAGLRERIPCMRLNGPEPGPARLSTNVNVSLEFVEGEGVALAADLQGVALASGAACGAQAQQPSPVLLALGLNRDLARGNLILTLGRDSTDAEIDEVVELLPAIVGKLRGMSPLWEAHLRGAVSSTINSTSVRM